MMIERRNFNRSVTDPGSGSGSGSYSQSEQPRKRVKLLTSIPSHSPIYAARSKLFDYNDVEVEWCSQINNTEVGKQVERDGPPTDVLIKSRWGNMLFVVADARAVGKMLAGDTETELHAIIRSWDATKPILMVPQMSVDEWRNPITKHQLLKLRIRMPWVTVLDPVLWDIPQKLSRANSWKNLVWDWRGEETTTERLLQTVRTCLEMGAAGKKVYPLGKTLSEMATTKHSRNTLPPEILTMIFEFVGDWELAQKIGIYTSLPTPSEWFSHIPSAKNPGSLEYTILTRPFPLIRSAFSSAKPKSLSDLATKLIFKFSMTDVLTYLSVEQKDIFWTSFGLTLLPHRASVQFNNPTILTWWLESPAIIKKDYGPEAVDGASRMGFVPVLDWWLNSGLTMLYTERALESASSKGHTEVLEWWKRAAELRANSDMPIKLKVGKSILSAAQSGRGEALEWWEKSGIQYGHEDGVARLASAHGHVNALRKWFDLKGGKMVFDNQVLVGATKNGHADVLEWWKQSGLRVEYKTCDIEEAMEDSAVGGDREDQVRQWWERNGLNLGVGTNEWMKVKCLQVD